MFLAFFIANFAYLMFAIAVSTFIYKFLKKKEIFGKYKRVLFSMLIAILIFFAPQWDLLIQKAIKTYYENFKMIEEIYAYPEFDENGRIESLGVEKNVFRRTASYLKNSKDLQELKDDKKSVKNFVEYYFFGSFKKIKDKKGNIQIKELYAPDIGYARVYFNKNLIMYKKLSNSKEFKARYQILATINNYYFYTEKIIEYWDTKKNILMAKGLRMSFPVKNEKDKFRYKYLLNHGSNGIGMGIREIDNRHIVDIKLFGFITI